jgi:transposase
MMLIGVDYHPSFQTIAFFVEETGECGEQELNHSDGQAEKFYRDLKQGQTLSLVDAAKMLELSYRQAKRLWQRYREEGAKGLQHRSAGRSSNPAKPEKFRRKVLQLIREKYSGTEQQRFGPTLAAEHLAHEDGLEVGEETRRRWMLAEGLWNRMRRRKAHRKRRERRQHFGDLLRWMGVSIRGLRSGTTRMSDEYGG